MGTHDLTVTGETREQLAKRLIREMVAENDAELGMTWWNRLTERERAEWLRRADTAVPAEAWEAFKRGAFQP
jgi:hypothetical protein